MTNKGKYKLKTVYRKLLADTVTPVSIYLKIRDKFKQALLLESSDYHGAENSFSYICFEPVAGFVVQNERIQTTYPDGQRVENEVNSGTEVLSALHNFTQAFDHEQGEFKFIYNGLFGYMAYDAVRYFEDVNVNPQKDVDFQIPDIQYHVYRFVIAIDHHTNSLYVFEHKLQEEEESHLDHLVELINNKNYASYTFARQGEEVSNYSNEEFLDILKKGQKHCFLGDVFQIVLSRRFAAKFTGDEFNVYRSLRSINPSPYLFYFDYGNFKIFGSSPEAQIVVKNGQASIYPIAGTFRRTGNDQADAALAQQLYEDPKENSEHVMLVDLARNDLSRNGSEVTVETFKEVQYFSHVIHLVSKVSCQLHAGTNPIQLVADTFPAGTLSGAPKHMAMQLIEQYENKARSFYGGAIGFMGFNGDFNHAIMIRTFLSQANTLYFQAGAGVVAKSNIPSELQEVNNKLEALRKALVQAENINA